MDGRTLKVTQSHTGFRQESPFVIARLRYVSGGKIGGTLRFFQAETTVLEPSQNVFLACLRVSNPLWTVELVV